MICSFFPMYSTLMFFSTIYSLTKWYLIRMCLIFECITRFLEILMTLVLSQKIGRGSSNFTWRSCKVCFIQRTWVQQVVVATYFISAMGMRLKIPSFSTTKQDNHLNRRLLHQCSYDQHHFLPNLHWYKLNGQLISFRIRQTIFCCSLKISKNHFYRNDKGFIWCFLESCNLPNQLHHI